VVKTEDVNREFRNMTFWGKNEIKKIEIREVEKSPEPAR
jgi:hypothetical protein